MQFLKKYSIKFLIASLFTTVFAGCVKDNEFFEDDLNETSRQSTVRIVDAGGDPIQRARNTTPTIDTFVLMEIRRDAVNLDEPLTVKLVRDTTLPAGFTQLPNSSFTLLSDINNITFAPGEFVKQIMIRLDKSQLDLSKQYALRYSIADPGTGAISIEDQKTAVYAVGIKNKYDGRYTMAGTLTDVAVPALTAKSPTEIHFVTSGANSVVLFNAGTAIGSFANLFPILNAGAESAYGTFMPIFTFDPVTNKVISVTNFYGQPASSTRRAEIDPSGVNMWDPVTKTLRVRFFMFQPSVVPTGPRTSFDFTFTYLGPR